ncbi:hypothetical protein GCM10023195_88150 [Actinoallomurus liliacearum]|uniref:Uncharacterized protein n=1 Tax=Actinoallomurus liliacearum TaxID=1080073 RepID=A0ABP8TYF1_9ACTN
MSSAKDDALWAELMDVAGGDPARAALVRSSLRSLAAGPVHSPLREMAREVLAGRSGFRAAALSDAYSPSFTTAFQTFCKHYEQTAESKRREVVAKGNTILAKLRERLSEEKG